MIPRVLQRRFRKSPSEAGEIPGMQRQICKKGFHPLGGEEPFVVVVSALSWQR